MITSAPNFSLVIGGPTHRLMERFGLMGPDRLPLLRGALTLAAIAWLPLAVLSVASFLLQGNEDALSFFADYPTHIRCLLAIFIMIVTERSAHFRLMPIVRHFRDARLIAPEAISDYYADVAKADNLTASRIAEAMMLIIVLVFAAAAATASVDITVNVFSWDGQVVGDEGHYTWAGYWNRWVSRPLFQFLLLRWLWRFFVWALLLLRTSLLPLRLQITHPDRTGGLGFLAIYPTVFSGFLFALSCVVAAQLASEALATDITNTQLQILAGSWIALCFAGFAAPVLFFVRPLYRLREDSTFLLGKLASATSHAFEKKWLDGDTDGAELLGSGDPSSLSDLAPAGASPYSLQLIPLTLQISIQLLASITAPLLGVVLTRVPFSALAERVFSLIS